MQGRGWATMMTCKYTDHMCVHCAGMCVRSRAWTQQQATQLTILLAQYNHRVSCLYIGYMEGACVQLPRHSRGGWVQQPCTATPLAHARVGRC